MRIPFQAYFSRFVDETYAWFYWGGETVVVIDQARNIDLITHTGTGVFKVKFKHPLIRLPAWPPVPGDKIRPLQLWFDVSYHALQGIYTWTIDSSDATAKTIIINTFKVSNLTIVVPGGTTYTALQALASDDLNVSFRGGYPLSSDSKTYVGGGPSS